MLDVKFIRENTAKVKTRLAMRGKSYDEEIDQILALDDERRAIIGKVESQKAEQKRISKSIPQLKKKGEDVSGIMAEMKQMSEEVKALDARRTEVENALHDALLGVPNVPADQVPEGADDTCNPEVRRWGEPTQFDFEPKAHWDIGKELGVKQELLMMVEHMILSHHDLPEYGSPKPPMFPEAEVLHMLDLLDARMFEMTRALKNAQPGGFTERIWSLERRLYRRKETPVKDNQE